MKTKTIDFERMTQADIAAVLGVTTRTIQNWSKSENLPWKAGRIPRNRDGTYHSAAVLNWVKAHDILQRVERSR